MRGRNAVVVTAWLLLGPGGADAQEARLIYYTPSDSKPFTCDPDGKNAAKFTLPLPKKFEKSFNYPVRTPDGKKVAFYACPNGKGSGYYVADGDGMNVKKVVGDGDGFYRDFCWFPDGKRLVWSDTSCKGIRAVNVDGSGLAVLSPENEICECPSVSPDGKKIALVRGRKYDPGSYPDEPPGAVAVMDADGQNLQSVHRLHKKPDGGKVAWSPDGKRLLFNDVGDLYVINPDGKDLKQLTKLGGISDFAWSPDGKLIAFSRNRNGTSDKMLTEEEFKKQRYDIHVMQADGSNAKAIVKNLEFVPPGLGWWAP